ncbi:RNA 3'-terminal phosphate cyclase [Trichinella zimbabwensis]|uniref:RNA 3'-terminal phosphate cyclase n=1 Tax=Trichinella zimbabwensis TaxID=268475 RepID=A0A0V1I592_9BILA|nr:RNA 3'-terminal phosphate cyclase [Trichinella zimbabwensis]
MGAFLCYKIFIIRESVFILHVSLFLKIKNGKKEKAKSTMISEDGIISIDGGILEGGGQILRIACAYSALLNKPIRIFNIRAGRKVPGLSHQHLCGLKIAKKFCKARLIGAEVGSTEITFIPSKLTSGYYYADIKTAGSVSLLIQLLLPCLIFGRNESRLCLKGGTNVHFAPPIDYFLDVFCPIAEKFGIHTTCSIPRRGFFPKGGGEVNLSIYPVNILCPINLLNRGSLCQIDGKSYVAGGIPYSVTKRCNRQLADQFATFSSIKPIDFDDITFRPSFSEGFGIMAIAEYSNGCLLAVDRIAENEHSGDELIKMIKDDMKAVLDLPTCVDPHLQDQLIILMALASGVSKIRTGPLTLHTKTAIYVTQQMTNAVITVDEADNGTFIITCVGIGLKNDYK